MYRLKVLNQMRMVLSPVAIATATFVTTGAVNIVNAAAPDPPAPPPPDSSSEPKECDPNKPLVRAKDLPIYFTPDGKLHKQKPQEDEDKVPDDILMSAVKEGRKTIWKTRDQFSELGKSVDHFFETGKAHLESSVQQLREPENANLRYGVIGGGGLVGLLFSLRGGIFKKVFYTSAGALAMAAVCYPVEADEYSSKVYQALQDYSRFTYHFTNAALKDLAGVELTIPKLSTKNPFEIINIWIGKENEVSKTSPSSATLLPPVAETPSHVVPLSSTTSTSKSSGISLSTKDLSTSMTQKNETRILRDQSNPDDRDMYSLRG
ncbi:MICOS complex subunit 26/27 isoform X2 [Lycorma delicatula]|uniref:MICOS complex subunit 26/27 isoform X2 n=1 Tax=Lycorma delicatula TaxID=130591 RepID=UPI003F50F389